MPGRKKKRKQRDKSDKDEPSVCEDLPDPEGLEIVIDGKPRKFTDYTREFARRHYPEVVNGPIVVPPVVFHHNWLLTDKSSTKQLRQFLPSGVGKEVTVADVSHTSEHARRASEAEYKVAEGFRHLAQTLGGPCAVILGHKYENYLSHVRNKLRNVHLPSDLPGTAGDKRGEHDLLFIHPPSGICLVSVKSVGGNFAERNLSVEEQHADLIKAIRKAVPQLRTEVKVVEHVLGDLSPPVTPVLALPNIDRELLTAALEKDKHLQKDLDGVVKGDSSSCCIFSDDLSPLAKGDISGSASLCPWFHRRFPETALSAPALTQDQYEDIVGRYCGFCSIVDVTHRKSEGRIEVRFLPDAVTEVNRRFRSLLLLPAQVSLLCSGHLPRVYMYGMLGSGKTVMLTLMARHWLATGSDVIVVNVSYDVYGSPIGHALLRDIKDASEKERGDSQIAMVNVRLAEFDHARFLATLRETISAMQEDRLQQTPLYLGRIRTVPPFAEENTTAATEESRAASGISRSFTEESRAASGVSRSFTEESRATSGISRSVTETSTDLPESARPVCFVLDEVYPSFQPVFSVISEHFPESQVWAAGLEAANAPAGFEVQEMKTVLRCPPAVQRVLKRTDFDAARVEGYTACGASDGLPSEGPTPKFIFHQNHSSASSPSSSVSSPPPPLHLPPSSAASPSSSSLSPLITPSTQNPYHFMNAYSPLWCKDCAHELIQFLKHSLGINPTARGPELEKSSQGTESSPSKKSKPDVPRLKQKDVVVLVKDPDSKRVYPKVGDIYKLDKQLFQDFLSSVDESPFVQTLRSAGFSARTVRDASSGELAVCEEEEMTVSWVNPVSGLEWAVVIFIPGDPPKSTITQPGAGEAERGGGDRTTVLEPQDLQPPEPLPPNVKSQASEDIESSESQDWKNLAQQPSTSEAERGGGDPATILEPQCIQPLYPEPLPPNVESQVSASEDIESQDMKSCKAQLSRGDVMIEEGLTAVAERMSKRDSDYLFWGASRCTAQLIVIVP